MVLGDPAAGGELADQRAIQLAARRVVEIFETGLRHSELGLFQAAASASRLSRESCSASTSMPTRSSKLSGAIGGSCCCATIGVGHGAEAQGAEAVEGRFSQHAGSPSLVVGAARGRWRGTGRAGGAGSGVERQTIQAVFEHRLDVAIRARAGGDARGRTRRRAARGRAASPGAGCPGRSDSLARDAAGSRESAGRAPRSAGRWWRPSGSSRDGTPLQMRAVRLRHVLRDRRVAAGHDSCARGPRRACRAGRRRRSSP